MSPTVLFLLSLSSRVFLQMEGGVLRSPEDQRRAMSWITFLTNTNDCCNNSNLTWTRRCVVLKDQISDTWSCVTESVRSLINLYLRFRETNTCVGKRNVTTVFSLLMKHFCSLHWKTAAVHTNHRFTVYSHEGTKRQHRCFLLLVRNSHLTYDYLFTSVRFLH